LNCTWDGVRSPRNERSPFGCSPNGLLASLNDPKGTGIELWVERFRVEFCLSPPANYVLAAFEALAA
jgi:hypothetical protein